MCSPAKCFSTCAPAKFGSAKAVHDKPHLSNLGRQNKVLLKNEDCTLEVISARADVMICCSVRERESALLYGRACRYSSLQTLQAKLIAAYNMHYNCYSVMYVKPL